MADDAHNVRPTVDSIPHRVSVYAENDDDTCSLVHTEDCPDERQARNFALNRLMADYMEIAHSPQREAAEQRARWCELAAGQRMHGQFRPDPHADGDVDIFELDTKTGLITFDPWASLRRWRPRLVVCRD